MTSPGGFRRAVEKARAWIASPPTPFPDASSPPETALGGRAAATVLALFLALRATHLFFYFIIDSGGFHFFRYDDIGRALIALRQSRAPAWGFGGIWLPLPFWLNGAMIHFFGGHRTVPIVGNILWSTLLLVGVYAVARRLAPRTPWAALIAVGLLAKVDLFNHLSLSGGAEILFQGCVVWALFFLHRHWDTERPVDLAAAVLLFSAASLTRYEAWPWAAIAGAAILWKHRGAARHRRGAAFASLAVLVAPFLIPRWAVDNRSASPLPEMTRYLRYAVTAGPEIAFSLGLVLFRRVAPAVKRHAALTVAFIAPLLAVTCWQKISGFERVALVIVTLAAPLSAAAAAEIARPMESRRAARSLMTAALVLLAFALWKTAGQEYRPGSPDMGLFHAARVFADARAHFTEEEMPRAWTDPYVPPDDRFNTYAYQAAPMFLYYAAPDRTVRSEKTGAKGDRAALTSFLGRRRIDFVVTSNPATIAALSADFVFLGRAGRYSLYHRAGRRTTEYFRQMFRAAANRPADSPFSPSPP